MNMRRFQFFVLMVVLIARCCSSFPPCDPSNPTLEYAYQVLQSMAAAQILVPAFNLPNIPKVYQNGLDNLPHDHQAQNDSLALYDWSTPSFNRIYSLKYLNFSLELFNEMLVYNYYLAYNLYGLFPICQKNTSCFQAETTEHFELFKCLNEAEILVITSALQHVDQTDSSIKVLYRGNDWPNKASNFSALASFVCTQFEELYLSDLTNEGCLQRLSSVVGSTLTTRSFWSTTPNEDDGKGYAFGIIWTILPNRSGQVSASSRCTSI
jgi:hypothetical protein